MHHRRPDFFTALTLFLLLGFPLVGMPSLIASDAAISFRNDLWPIIEERCLPCHNASNAEGDLRLDKLEWVKYGGHTGAELIGSVDDSELLRRLQSKESGYRMPKGQVPLTEDQIEIFRNWIQQGAPWEEVLEPDNQLASSTADTDFYWLSLDTLAELETRFRWVIVAGLIFLVSALVLEKSRATKMSRADFQCTQAGTMKQPDAGRSGLNVYYLVMACSIGLATALIQINALNNEIAELQTKVASFQRPAIEPSTNYEIPLPIKPGHGQRLGGEYYRGNDERSPKLFNGGHYRTAKMTLSLVDEKGNELNYGDVFADRTLGITLRVERSPNATRSLFRDKAMTSCVLTRRIPGIDSGHFVDDHDVPFSIVDPGECWQASYWFNVPQQVQESENTKVRSAVTPMKGRIYVCPRSDAAHYGIEYNICVRDGKISEQSELWMGAIYVTSKVVVPKEGEIPLTQWFDHEPIPEILGENSMDRDLLGITEHELSGQYP